MHPYITAHSGCDNTPDNSLESVRRGIALGADFVEVDVRLDPNGVPRLTHDMPAAFDALPTLEDALRLAAEGGVGVNCDLKESAALDAALALGEACGLDSGRLAFSGDVPVARLLAEPDIARRGTILLNSEILCAHMAGTDTLTRAEQSLFIAAHPDQVRELLAGTGARALNAPYQALPLMLLRGLRACGVALSLWTVSDQAALRQLLGEDLFNITTRTVGDALRLRGGV